MTGALPEHAALLRDFANTVDVDDGTDALTDPAALAVWLRRRDLIPGHAGGVGAAGQRKAGAAGQRKAGAAGRREAATAGHHDDREANDADLDIALALRSSLRAAMRAHHQRDTGGPGATASAQGPAPRLETAAANLPLRVAESAGNPALVPMEDGIRGGLARLAAAIVASTSDRSWERLKICAEDSCQWAFFDPSKNRSKHWCSMQECGNRSKTRAYRARRARGKSGP